MINNQLMLNPALVPDSAIVNNKKYFVFNISKGQDYYSQLKSQYSYENGLYKSDKYSFCNVTMMGMALIYMGFDVINNKRFNFMYPEYPRLPDKLAKFMFENKQVLEFYKNKFPSQYKKFITGKYKVSEVYGPNEIHACLSYGTNLFVDRGIITYFSTKTPWKDIIEDIVYKGTPVGISGKFSNYNHIVLMVGVAYKELENGDRPGPYQIPDYIIVDDPLGKTFEYNKNLPGNDIWIPFEQCVSSFKDVNDEFLKMTHRFIKPRLNGLD